MWSGGSCCVFARRGRDLLGRAADWSCDGRFFLKNGRVPCWWALMVGAYIGQCEFLAIGAMRFLGKTGLNRRWNKPCIAGAWHVLLDLFGLHASSACMPMGQGIYLADWLGVVSWGRSVWRCDAVSGKKIACRDGRGNNNLSWVFVGYRVKRVWCFLCCEMGAASVPAVRCIVLSQFHKNESEVFVRQEMRVSPLACIIYQMLSIGFFECRVVEQAQWWSSMSLPVFRQPRRLRRLRRQRSAWLKWLRWTRYPFTLTGHQHELTGFWVLRAGTRSSKWSCVLLAAIQGRREVKVDQCVKLVAVEVWRDRRKCHLPWFGRLRTCGEHASAWAAEAARNRVPWCVLIVGRTCGYSCEGENLWVFFFLGLMPSRSSWTIMEC